MFATAACLEVHKHTLLGTTQSRMLGMLSFLTWVGPVIALHLAHAGSGSMHILFLVLCRIML